MAKNKNKPSEDTGGGLASNAADYTATLKISQLNDEVFATLEFNPLVTTPEIANTPAYILMSNVVEYYMWRTGIVDDEGNMVHPEALGRLEDFDIKDLVGDKKVN